jgi:hypothetical protein
LNVFVKSLDLVALVLNEIGLDFADWGRLTGADAGGGVRVPDSGRLEDDMVVVRKAASSDKAAQRNVKMSRVTHVTPSAIGVL